MLSYDPAPSHFKPHHAMVASVNLPTVRTFSQVPMLRHKHLFIITGPAGCGKTTLAKRLADYYSLPYLEGDDYHPEANIEKMRSGQALTDADRWDWLIELKEAALDHLDAGVPGVLVTCSALKRKYRDVIRVARLDDHEVRVHFIYLRATEELLMERVMARSGHYMKSSMVQSQLQCLEEPKEKERDVFSIDVSDNDSVELEAREVVTNIMALDMAKTRKS